jgi:hypothetical protein
MEVTGREDALREVGLSRASFASLLIDDSPLHIHEKLQGWGVADYKSLFSRAIGLNAVFAAPPEPNVARGTFLMDYHRYSDGFYKSWNETHAGRAATPEAFTFDLFASGEYSRILEQQFERDMGAGDTFS